MSRKEKEAERSERKQQRVDAGLMSTRYPSVASIVVVMNYYQRGMIPPIMKRTVNFFPSSAAFFLMECMKYDCIDGGFDLEPVIATMVRGRLESGSGELVCQGNDSSGHAHIDYNIAIHYHDADR